jgi:uncharacterized protein (TIGR03437 family)
MKIFLIFAILASVPMWAATGNNIAVDGQGNVWWTGQSLPVAITANAFQKTDADTLCATQQLSPFDQPTALYCSHAFVMKLDPAGNVLYATYLGGSSEDGGIAITTDAQGNAYVTGFTYSADFPVTAGVVQRQNAGPLTPTVVPEGLGPFGPVGILPGGDIFVAKFAPDGTLLYSTLLGGSGSDVPALIEVDASGSAYVTGTTASTNFPVTSDAMSHQSGSGNFFVRLDPQAASLVYATYSDATIQSFDVDGQGDAFLTGSSVPSGGGAGPYVTEVDTASGQALYTTFLPELDSKFAGTGAAIAVNGAGEATVGVSPAPITGPFLVPSPPIYPLGASFLLRLAAGGAMILSVTDLAATQFDGVLPDSAGNAYAFGHGTGALPPAPITPLLSVPCSSAGGEFVIETDAAGSVAAATYLRQGSGDVAVIGAPGQLSVYWAVTETQARTAAVNLLTVPPMNFGCLQNLASGLIGAGVAPGEIFALFGSNLGPAKAIAGVPDASGRFPTSLSGVQVLINGTAAPLLLVDATEIEGVVPFDATDGATTQVQYLGQSAPPLDAPNAYTPGIFTINGQAAVLNQDGTVNTPSNPAGLGTIVAIYETGTGPLTDPLEDGEITPLPPPYFLLASPPQVTFAGVTAKVVWAGAAPGLVAGAMQINAQLPASLPADTNLAAVPVVLSLAGLASPAAPISVSISPAVDLRHEQRLLVRP